MNYYIARMDNDSKISEFKTLEDRDIWLREHKQKGTIILETGEIINSWYKGRKTMRKRKIHM
jgi:hypothetical protein